MDYGDKSKEELINELVKIREENNNIKNSYKKLITWVENIVENAGMMNVC